MVRKKISSLREKISYGEIIEGLVINGNYATYPVLNERAVRAGAGITFAAAFFSFFQALFLQNMVFIRYFVLFMLVDFFIKVVISPKFSPVSVVANLIVKNQKPEYVGAVQKRFAWSLGLIMASVMTVLVYGFSITGIVPLSICSLCLILMFMETSFGICVGCLIYYKLMELGLVVRPDVLPACPGGACPMPKKK